ncbi:hypothetical protein [Halorussus sp. MSC15.2]|uniref:hypothetical protein n=1 Tax=Halorussus sp. MSC15.2 TaxID=2283638 RepID=UPI0013D14A07|nr:hypothetical protein [Halorussus sp. MSC15.2]NEU58969.1 hypothetical protein [Halorussus sp. MSC15.2]
MQPNRRTLLKSASMVGLAGIGVAGTASAQDAEGDENEDGEYRELTICSTTETTFNFVVEVSGEIRRGGEFPTDEYDEVGPDYVEGQVWKEKCDSYRFTGEIERLDRQGPGEAEVFVDGEPFAGTSQEGDGGEQEAGGEETRRLPKEVVVSSPDTDEFLTYQFRVTGDLEKLEPNEDSSDAVDDVIDLGEEGTRVEGGVGSGDDRFAFSGELVREDVLPEVELTVSER